MLQPCVVRKRIWEVDCITLDAVLASSFDWKELVNLLSSTAQIQIPVENVPVEIIEMQAQNLVHKYCHSQNSVSLHFENLLNQLHEKVMEGISSAEPLEVTQMLIYYDFSKPQFLGGLLWALGTDSRDAFHCIRKRFHQRLQVAGLRHLLRNSA